MSVTLLLAGLSKPSAQSKGVFGTINLHGRHYPLPLLLACFRAYASSKLLPDCLQDSILGLWLAVIEAGFPPARIRDIAQPQPTEPQKLHQGSIHLVDSKHSCNIFMN
jgi:hypothetical protein